VKKIAAILLSLAILLQSCGNLSIVVGYELNKENLTRLFCINKDKPTLHCNGKCYLAGQLKEHQKNEQLPVSKTKEKHELTYFFQATSILNCLSNSESNQRIPIHNDYSLQDMDYAVFQPPG
jgi:hypothetical protein